MSGEKSIRDYKDLTVWQKAMTAAKHVYEVSCSFPPSEVYGLMSQVRRAAVSVPSNIAEGQSRRTTKDFVHFLYVARGSLAELDTQFRLAQILGFITEAQSLIVLDLVDELKRMLYSLIVKLEQ